MTMAPLVGEITLDLLPARQGDALLLTWGPPGDRRRMLVDAGPATAYPVVARRLAELVGSDPLNLLVLTHIDGDHIEGTILLTNDADVALDIREVWYNGSAKLVRELGEVQGEILAAIIRRRNLAWNTQAGGRAISLDAEGQPPCYPQPGGLSLTVLGPDHTTLRALRDRWLKVCEDAKLTFGSVDEALEVLRGRPNLQPGSGYLGPPRAPKVRSLLRTTLDKDTKLPNRSSIVLLAEAGDVSLLLAGDATPAALEPAVRNLLRVRGIDTLPLTAFKLPHHGSARNLTRELLRMLPADCYLFSSDGSQFGHPDEAAVAMVLEYGKPGAQLVFNYRNARTSVWADPRLADQGYRPAVRYPEAADLGVRVAFSGGARC
jgi:beta-lactamase superfamily II metal-dependent hydrolase